MVRRLSDNRPVYVEDFFRGGPDAFNGNASGGDSDTDWWPAFMRALTRHVDLDLQADSLARQRTYPPTVFLGAERQTYPISKTLHVFGICLKGLYEHIVLDFTGTGDCIVVHYPDSGGSLGTFHPEEYPIDPALSAYEGYGSSTSRIENIFVEGNDVEGRRGIVLHRKTYILDCFVRNCGWHGIHVNADVTRTYAGNANGFQIHRTAIYDCGAAPGFDSVRSAPWRLDTRRGFGSGLRIQGGDGNIGVTLGLRANFNAYAGVHDSGFLGNLHAMPHVYARASGNGGYQSTQELRDIYDGAVQWVADNPSGGSLYNSDLEEWTRLNGIANADETEFRYYDSALNDYLEIGYVVDNPNARTLLQNPYCEASPIIDVRKPSMVQGGIGGRQLFGVKIQGVGVTGEWETRPRNGIENSNNNPPTYAPAPSMVLGPDDNTGAVFRLEHGSSRGSSVVERLRYVNFYDDDPNYTPPGGHPSLAGFWVMDSRVSNLYRTLMLSAHESSWQGRDIEEGRIVIPQRFYLGKKRITVSTTDPQSQDPAVDSLIGGGAHEEGDLMFWVRDILTPGDPVLYVCVDNNGTLEWEPRL